MNQKQALDILKTGTNVFLTGSAGSGKTYVLNQYIALLKEHRVRVGVTASTGIAATHMNGMTIHAWSGVGVRSHLSERDIALIGTKPQIRRRFRNTQVLIIDEVSMIHAHMLDMIDVLARVIREDERPFGGMQVVVTGDFFQLPPVSREGDAVFATEAEVWHTAKFTVCYLATQFRQKDDALTQILNDMRDGSVTEKTRELLRSRIGVALPEQQTRPTKLYTHNADVDAINTRELSILDTRAQRYVMATNGSLRIVEALMRSCLSPQSLVVKIDAVVMFVRNNFDRGYVNGTLGHVVDFTERGFPVVETFDGEEIVAEPESWAIEEDGNVKASLRQVPLRLAWAITVHKSQGMTLDAAEIDLSKSFVPGMGYVALSRVRSLDGLMLDGFNDMALMVNEAVLMNDRDLQEQSCDTVERLKKIAKGDLEKKHKDFLCIAGTKSGTDKAPSHEKTWKLFVQGASLEEIARERGFVIGTIISHIEKSVQDGCGDADLSELKKQLSDKQMKEIFAVFDKFGIEMLAPIRQKLGDDYTFDEIRIARIFYKK